MYLRKVWVLLKAFLPLKEICTAAPSITRNSSFSLRVRLCQYPYSRSLVDHLTSLNVFPNVTHRFLCLTKWTLLFLPILGSPIHVPLLVVYPREVVSATLQRINENYCKTPIKVKFIVNNFNWLTLLTYVLIKLNLNLFVLYNKTINTRKQNG